MQVASLLLRLHKPILFLMRDKWVQTFSRRWPNLLLRCVVLLAGFTGIALGVAFSRHTEMGVSPISCIPNVLSFCLPQLTIGQHTMAFNTLMLMLQIALLRHKFHPIQLLQIVCTMVFSCIIDFFVPIVELIPVPNYATCIVLQLIGLCCTSIGVFLEVNAAMIPLSGEGLSVAISQVFKIPFHRCKIGMDVVNAVVATIISLIALGGLVGVREGTVLVACCTGLIVKLINKLLPNFSKYVPVANEGLFLRQEISLENPQGN